MAEVQALFSDLYDIQNTYRQQPENFEVVVGNGVLSDLSNPSINHPVFLKRVRIELKAESDTIEIWNTDTPSELYMMLLSSLQNVNNDAAKPVQDQAQKENVHPLDPIQGKSLMRGLLTKLTSKGRWIDENADFETSSNDENLLEMRWKPIFFLRKKVDGTPKTIEILENEINKGTEAPPVVIGIVDPSKYQQIISNKKTDDIEYLSNYEDDVDDILLPKPANREQIEIARQVERHAAVLVQGPPGTGKTHTIANLVCHFLAQGKRILITSQTNKALRVLKDKIPVNLQPLCVSMLDDSNADMEKSVDAIVDYISTNNSVRSSQEADKSGKLRDQCYKELNESRNLVRNIMHKEFEPIAWCGMSLSPLEAAKLVASRKDVIDLIPGEIPQGCSFPLTETELKELYETNLQVSADEENELNQKLPDPNTIISPDQLEDYWKRLAEIQKWLDSINNQAEKFFLWNEQNSSIIDNPMGIVYAEKTSETAINSLKSIQQYYPQTIEQWMTQLVIDGSPDKLQTSKWNSLLQSTVSIYEMAEQCQKELSTRNVVLTEDTPITELIHLYTQLCEKSKAKGKINTFGLLFLNDLKKALESVQIDGKKPSTYDDINLVLRWLQLQEGRIQLVKLWNELLVPLGESRAEDLGSAPEIKIYQKIDVISFWLNWFINGRFELLTALSEANVRLVDQEMIENLNLTSNQNVYMLLSRLPEQINLAISMAEIVMLLSDSAERLQTSLHTLERHKSSKLCVNLSNAVFHHDISEYRNQFNIFITISKKMPLLIRRRQLLKKLKTYAHEWADAIQNRNGIHGHSIVPDEIIASWQLKQLDTIVQEICDTSLPEAEQRVRLAKSRYQKSKVKLASDLAWNKLQHRIEGNYSIQSSLNGWKQTIKKIGKGKGKKATSLRQEAQKLMADSQQAVPAWIMPISKVMDTIDPSKVKFDIVIVDEASQADITSIPILFMGKKVIIVGDDEQVSPMAIGIPDDKIANLQATYIKNHIPNTHLYDASFSLYALAGSICKPLMLREHFRCVPEIIGYSNWLSYDGKIKPLREKTATHIHPAVIPYRVNGQRKGKTNEVEAETIVAAICACIESPSYKNETFGVIPMLGTDQVKLINRLLFEHISLLDREKHQILCGDASSFQGDERSVIFLSLVDSNEGDGPLRKTTEGRGDSTKQRYNVAFSRAQNQIWVVYSLDPAQSLKKGDIRRDMLEYANDPNSFIRLIEQVEKVSESPFEEEVAKHLITSGFQVKQQYPVGAYRLDMVVGNRDKKVVLECDGERFHSSEEELNNDIERQDTLERLGWNFIRLRGSEYYRNKEKAMNRVIQDLRVAGVEPSDTESNESEVVKVDPEKQKLITRIQQIVDSWHSDEEQEQHLPSDTITCKPQSEGTTKVSAEESHVSSVNGQRKALESEARTTRVTLDQSSNTKSDSNNRIEISLKPEIRAVEKTPQKVSPSLPADHKFRPINDIVREKTGGKASVSSATRPLSNTPFKERRNTSQLRRDSRFQNKSIKDNFIVSLKKSGFEVVDNRESSGILYVIIDSARKTEFDQLAIQYSLTYFVEKRGAFATENRPAWRIM